MAWLIVGAVFLGIPWFCADRSGRKECPCPPSLSGLPWAGGVNPYAGKMAAVGTIGALAAMPIGVALYYAAGVLG